MNLQHFKVEYDKTGAIFDRSQADAVVNAAPGFTDLIVISHGWNNDVDEASQLYDTFFQSIDAVLGVKLLADRLARPLAAADVRRGRWLLAQQEVRSPGAPSPPEGSPPSGAGPWTPRKRPNC